MQTKPTVARYRFLYSSVWYIKFLCLPVNVSLNTVANPLQVGACIVNEHQQIVSIGYNGMPIGCPDSDLPWGKAKASKEEDKHNYGKSANINVQ